MKLLYTLTGYPPSVGGAQIHQHFLAQQMTKKCDVEVMSHWNTNRTDWLLGTTLNSPKTLLEYTIDGISVHRMGFSIKEKIEMAPFIPVYYPLMSFALSRISNVIERHLECVAKNASLIHNVRIGREGITLASLKAARKRDIPFVLTPVHHPRWTGWRYKCYLDLYRRSDGVFTLTHSEKQTLVDLQVDPKKIHVIGHGPVLSEESDADSFRTKHKIQSPIILFLGQHYSYKGYKELLEATDIVWDKFPDAHFIFIGPSVKKSEKVFCQYADARIRRLGKVSLQEKTDALSACDVLCVPSSQESFGGVYAEAWMFEKPVIGCSIPAVSEVIDDGVNGFLVSQQADSIAEKIITLLEDSSIANDMGKKGKKKVQEHYSWSRIAEKATDAYSQILLG